MSRFPPAEINLNPEAAHCIFKKAEPCFVSGASRRRLQGALWMWAGEPGRALPGCVGLESWLSSAPRMNCLPGMLLVLGQAPSLSPCKGQKSRESAWCSRLEMQTSPLPFAPSFTQRQFRLQAPDRRRGKAEKHMAFRDPLWPFQER